MLDPTYSKANLFNELYHSFQFQEIFVQRSTKYMNTKTTSAGTRPVPAAAPAGKLKMPMPTMPGQQI